MEGNKSYLLVAMALVLATMMINYSVKEANAQLVPGEFCGITKQGIDDCMPYVTGMHPMSPSDSCCSSVRKADLPCLCKYRNSNLLRIYGINPQLVMVLPPRCHINKSFKCA